MPLYLYKCKSCGATEEVIAKMSDPAPNECKQCKAEGQMVRQLGRSSFRLKGGGWYAEGYNGTSNSGGTSSGGDS